MRPVSVNCSVAVILTRETEPRLLLIERARRVGDPWSGDLAFPGGRQSQADPSLLSTAIRETHEETGITLPLPNSALRLKDRLTKSHNTPQPMTITPFVFELDSPVPTQLNYEVASVMWVSIHQLRNTVRRKMRWKIGKLSVPVTYIPLGEKRLWGLTLSMVDELLLRFEQ